MICHQSSGQQQQAAFIGHVTTPHRDSGECEARQWRSVPAPRTMLLSWLLSLLSLAPEAAPPPANTTARPRTILVEGNVGSGKSSFLEIMSSVAGVEVFQEPVELWRNVGGDNLFEKMIKEPRRWTATFQLYSTSTRCSRRLRLECGSVVCRTQQMLEAQRSVSPTVMIERSLYSERYCFVEVGLDTGPDMLPPHCPDAAGVRGPECGRVRGAGPLLQEGHGPRLGRGGGRPHRLHQERPQHPA